jgi:hypothetical protein
MIIEFAIVGDGTNIEVLLIDRLDAGEPPAEAVVDHIYTADHKGGIHYGDDQKVPVSARQLFEWVEDSWYPPIIGGKYSNLHPYWTERAEKRKARAT